MTPSKDTALALMREHGHEALAAGEHLGLLPVLAHERERLVERRGPAVGERRRLHRSSSSQTRDGVSGTSTSSTPSASATAFPIAAGALIVVPSPRPLAPSVVNGDGVSTWPIVSGGRSAPVGQR